MLRIDFRKTWLKIVMLGAMTALLMWFGTVFWNIVSPVFGVLSPMIFLAAMMGLIFLSMNIHPGVENWGETILPMFLAVMTLGMLNLLGLPYPGLSFPKLISAELKPLVTIGYAGAMVFFADTIIEKLMAPRR